MHRAGKAGERAVVEQALSLSREQRELVRLQLAAKEMLSEEEAREAAKEAARLAKEPQKVEIVFVNDWREEAGAEGGHSGIWRRRVGMLGGRAVPARLDVSVRWVQRALREWA